MGMIGENLTEARERRGKNDQLLSDDEYGDVILRRVQLTSAYMSYCALCLGLSIWCLALWFMREPRGISLAWCLVLETVLTACIGTEVMVGWKLCGNQYWQKRLHIIDAVVAVLTTLSIVYDVFFPTRWLSFDNYLR